MVLGAPKFEAVESAARQQCWATSGARSGRVPLQLADEDSLSLLILLVNDLSLQTGITVGFSGYKVRCTAHAGRGM